MPLVGTRDLSAIAGDLPLLTALDTEPWTLPGATILQLMFEMDEPSALAHLPRCLHPTIPPTVVINVTQVPDSPVGPFTLAEVREGCRAATRPRGFLVRAYCDAPAAIEALRCRWGYPVSQAAVTLSRGHDRVRARVRVDDRDVLDGALINPDPISGGDVQYLANMNAARVQRDGAEVLRLVQVDPEYTFHRADRGRPHLDALDTAAWGLAGVVPAWPVSASCTVADIAMPQIRYLMDPAKLPLEAVERL